jgi:hypothetical protein
VSSLDLDYFIHVDAVTVVSSRIMQWNTRDAGPVPRGKSRNEKPVPAAPRA